MPYSIQTILFLLALAAISGVVMAYKFLHRFRFWFFDIWADLPLIGTIARRSRMLNPTKEKANARLRELYRAYKLHMPKPASEAEFNRIRRYLFLSGDARSKPTPAIAWALLLFLICTESYAVSFILGMSISGDMSQNRATMVALGVAFVFSFVMLILAHSSGHQLRRTRAIRSADAHSIDQDQPLPQGEKPIRQLCQTIDIQGDQEVDSGKIKDYPSQRQLNRIRVNEGDHGSYVLPGLFIAGVLIFGGLQFELRQFQFLGLSAVGRAAPEWANAIFVLIFYMTQGLALTFGYKYGFIGRQSADGYRSIGGRSSYSSYRDEIEPMIARADESLHSLYSKFKSRYSKIGEIDNLSFNQRYAHEMANPSPLFNMIPPDPSPDASPPAPSGDDEQDNVTAIKRDNQQ